VRKRGNNGIPAAYKGTAQVQLESREEPYVREDSRGEFRREFRGQRAVGTESEGGGVGIIQSVSQIARGRR